jgi:hypothetical protein
MWQPIPLEELDALVSESVGKSDVPSRNLFAALRIEPEKWALSPWGDKGGGFWVVGVLGRTAIWYNDIEDGFNVSRFEEWGRLSEYWCNQLELTHVLARLFAQISSLTPVPIESKSAGPTS